MKTPTISDLFTDCLVSKFKLFHEPQMEAYSFNEEMEIEPEPTAIQSLPLEILAKILAWVILSTPDILHGDKSRVLLPPEPNCPYLILAQICQRWRVEITTNPFFWTHYYLVIDGLANEFSLDLTKEWLSRGGQCTKDLVIATHMDEAEIAGHSPPLMPSASVLKAAMNVVSGRIRRLYLYNLSALDMEAIMDLPSGSFPLLEYLRIYFRLSQSLTPSITVKPVFSSSPLRAIDITVLYPEPKLDIVGLCFTYTQVRSLRLHLWKQQIPLKQLLEILGQCEILETFEIRMDVTLNDPVDPMDPPVIALPSCRDFCMAPMEFSDAYFRLGRLIQLPSVESFTIRCNRPQPPVPWNYDWYHHLLSPNIHRLRNLRLPDNTVPPTILEMVSLLSRATKLKWLQLGNCGSEVGDILRRLFSGALCPSLVSLDVCDRITYEVIALVHELYLSPSRPSIPLRKITFYNRSGHSAHAELKGRVQSLMSELKSAGLGTELYSS